MSYKGHEKLSKRLMYAYRTPPPPGYNKVSMSQIRVADEMFFELAGQMTRRGIQVSSDVPKLDELVDSILVDPRFSMLLTPLPKAAGRQRSRTPKRQRTKKDKGKGDSDEGKGGGKNSGRKQKTEDDRL